MKEHYNISENENLILLLMELENKKNQKKDEINNNEKSFNLDIHILINIFDLSGRKLDLSICEENINIGHNLDGYQEVDIKSAKNYAKRGIDVFNASDSFFNDLCHPYDDNKDIIIIVYVILIQFKIFFLMIQILK